MVGALIIPVLIMIMDAEMHIAKTDNAINLLEVDLFKWTISGSYRPDYYGQDDEKGFWVICGWFTQMRWK